MSVLGSSSVRGRSPFYLSEAALTDINLPEIQEKARVGPLVVLTTPPYPGSLPLNPLGGGGLNSRLIGPDW